MAGILSLLAGGFSGVLAGGLAAMVYNAVSFPFGGVTGALVKLGLTGLVGLMVFMAGLAVVAEAENLVEEEVW